MSDIEIVQRPMTLRELTEEELGLTRWLLENAESGSATKYLEQLSRAQVSGMCPCGCPSFDLRIDGMPEPTGGIGILNEYSFGEGNNLCDVFVFEQDNILAGVEVVWYGDRPPALLPQPSELRPTSR